MSSVVDERVVQMSFDNSQFEKGVSQTIGSLRELDNTLDNTANGEYFTKMEDGILKVKVAFDATSSFIFGALNKLGQEAVSTVIGFVKQLERALTSGINNGFAEYNTQMDATQTILANVKDEGKGIEDVTAALDELNRYADLTIYNFTEMTRNIGMFTAAGTNLNESVDTIKGLANAAALVGANASTAARAWYQVSQAMAAGTFRLMDWRSLEISNIAGEGFKTVLTEVARKDGIAIDSLIKKYGGLRDTLRDGWLSAQRFTEGMQILTNEWEYEDYVARGYTDEQIKLLMEIAKEANDAAVKVKTFKQLMETVTEEIGSGWAVTFRTIIGDFEKARKFFTRISTTLNKAIGKISDYRNHFINMIWNTDYFGRSASDDFKETVDNLLAIFTTFVGAIRAGFDNIFPWERIKKGLRTVTDYVNKYTKALVINDKQTDTIGKDSEGKDLVVETAKDKAERSNIYDLDVVNDNIKNLIRIFRGVFAAVDIVWITIRDIISFIFGNIPGLNKYFKDLKDGNLSLIESLADFFDKITKLHDIIVQMDLIPNILRLIHDTIIQIILTNPILYTIGSIIYGIITGIGKMMAKAKEMDVSPFTVIYGAIKLIAFGIASVVDFIISLFNKLGELLTGNSDFSFFDWIKQKIEDLVKFLDGIGKGTIDLGTFLDSLKEKFLNFFATFMDNPAAKILAVGAAVALLGTIISKVANSVNPLAIFQSLTGDISAIANTVKDTGITMLLNSFGDALLKITIAILALAVGFANMHESMFWAIGVVAALGAALLILVKSFEKIKTTISVGGGGGKADSIREVINGWLEWFKQLPAQIVSSFATVIKIIGIITLMNTFIDGIVKVVMAVVTLGSLPREQIYTAAGTVGILMVVIGVMVSLMAEKAKLLTKDNSLSILSLAAVLLMFGVAMNIIAHGISSMGNLNSEQILSSVLGLSVLVIAVGHVITSFEKEAKEAEKIDSIMLAIGGMFAAIGIGMAAIIAASSLITSTNQMITIGIGILGAILALAASVAAIALLMKYMKDNDISGTKATRALTTIAVVGAIVAAICVSFGVAGSALALSGATMEQMLPLLGLVISSLVAMVMVIIVLNNSTISIEQAGTAAIIAMSIAGTILIIAAAISMLNGVKIDQEVLVGMGVMVGIIIAIAAIIAILAVVGSEGVTEIAVAALLSISAFFLSIGALAWLISEAILNIQAATDHLIMFVANLIMLFGNEGVGQQILGMINNMVIFLQAAAPALHELFIALGELYIQIVGGFVEGMANKAMELVTRVGTLILTVLNSIAVWVNQNAATIQAVLVEVFKAILNIALIALNVALMVALPALLGLIMNLMTQILGFIIGAVMELHKTIDNFIADIFANILGEDNPVTQFFRNLADQWEIAKEVLDITIGEMTEMFNNLVTYAVEGLGLVANGLGLFVEASDQATEEISENTDEIIADNEALAETSSETSDQIVSDYEANAAASTESTNIQNNNVATLVNNALPALSGFLGDWTSMDLSFFGVDGDNFEEFLNNKLLMQNDYQVNSYNSDVEYLTKTSQLWTDYYAENGKYVAAYYEGMAEADEARKAGDYAALDRATSKMRRAQKAFEANGLSLSELLTGDNIDYDPISGKIINKITEPVYTSWDAMFKDFTGMWNSYNPGEVDTSAYNADYGSSSSTMDSGTDTSKLQQELNDRNSMIKDADSEIQPKDLTPTIDLDSLKNEVNQANSIMTGSLLAAQNAAIGDYINQDSELNPFLKDRWQNTYNFTQNNYSPKALSRIDIYRQTQNQLRLSRGY